MNTSISELNVDSSALYLPKNVSDKRHLFINHVSEKQFIGPLHSAYVDDKERTLDKEVRKP